MSTLVPGLRHTLTITVDDTLIVPAVFPAWPSFGAMPPVFATAFMIGLMELACVEGRHQRAIIARERFMTGVARKARMVA